MTKYKKNPYPQFYEELKNLENQIVNIDIKSNLGYIKLTGSLRWNKGQYYYVIYRPNIKDEFHFSVIWFTRNLILNIVKNNIRLKSIFDFPEKLYDIKFNNIEDIKSEIKRKTIPFMSGKPWYIDFTFNKRLYYAYKIPQEAHLDFSNVKKQLKYFKKDNLFYVNDDTNMIISFKPEAVINVQYGLIELAI